MTAVAAARTIGVGAHRYPLLLPKLRDPRLHLASVIFSLQILGQTVLGFDLSIAQILVSLGTCAFLETSIAFWQRRVIMWPASALLTGNGVAFILRVPGTEHGDWWSLNGWYIFSATAAIGLLSKYLIRVGDRHVFNPANFGLVVTFLILGSQHADPQDLWWGPMSAGIAAVLVVIAAGGIAITRRIGLGALALAFYMTFAAGTGVLAASGHCITARWNANPVCDASFWWVLVSSPEVLVFSLFMITDPRTVPAGKVGRLWHGAAVGVLATLMVAPQTTEFATKVAILASLVIVCAMRPLLERWAPAPGSARDAGRTWMATAADGSPALVRRGSTLALALAVGAFATLGMGRLAGDPVVAGPAVVAAVERPDTIVVPEGAVPKVRIGDSARRTRPPLESATAQRMGHDLAEALLIEAEAFRTGDVALLEVAATAPRLAELTELLTSAEVTPRPTYEFDEMTVELLRDANAPQAPPRLGIVARGTRRLGDGAPEQFAAAFPLVDAGGTFLIIEELPAPP